MLKKLLPPTGVAAEFESEALTVGTAKLQDRTLLCVFNWSNEAARIPVKLARPGEVSDLWSGQDYGRRTALDVPLKAHEGTVLVVR